MTIRIMNYSENWRSAVMQSNAPLVYLNTPRQAGKTTLLRSLFIADKRSKWIFPNFSLLLEARHALRAHGFSHQAAGHRTCVWGNDIHPSALHGVSTLLIEEPDLCKTTPMLDTDRPPYLDPGDGKEHYHVLPAAEIAQRWINGFAGHHVIMAGTAHPPHSLLMLWVLEHAHDSAECIFVIADDAYFAAVPGASSLKKELSAPYYRTEIEGIFDEPLFKGATNAPTE